MMGVCQTLCIKIALMTNFNINDRLHIDDAVDVSVNNGSVLVPETQAEHIATPVAMANNFRADCERRIREF